MAKKKSKKYSLPLLVAGVFILLLAGGIFRQTFIQSTQHLIPLQIVPTPTPAADLVGVLADVAVAYPSAPWSNPLVASQETFYGLLTGAEMHATTTSQTASLQPFMSPDDLARLGFTIDKNLYANGAGSGMWGYKRTVNKKSQILLFSYTTHPTSQKPNGPLQFTCPCKMDITIFASSPF